MSKFDIATDHPRVVAKHLGIPVYDLPRKPPATIPFAVASETAEDGCLWLTVGPEPYVDGGMRTPANINQAMVNASSMAKPAVLCAGTPEGSTKSHYLLYFHRGDGYTRHHFRKWFENRSHFYEYFGIPEDLVYEDPVQQLNPIFFTARMLPHKDPVPGFKHEPFDPMQRGKPDDINGKGNSRKRGDLPKRKQREQIVIREKPAKKERAPKPPPAPRPTNTVGLKKPKKLSL